MPNLANILKNKKVNIEASKFIRKPSIATEDRPCSPVEAASIQLKTESNVETIQDELEPNLSQTEAKVEPNLSQTEAKVEPNLSQTEAKVEPNLSQTEAKVEPNLSQTEAKVEPNLSQTEAKVEPNLSQTEAKVEPNLSQTEAKVEPNLSQTEAKVEPNLSQTEAKVEPSKDFLLLVGLQKQITIFLFEECQSALAEETPGLTIDYISMSCNTTKSAARKALQRLEKKKIIIRSDFKNGRAGWTRYKLPDVIYQEIHHLKSLNKLEPKLSQIEVRRLSNLSQTEAKLRTELEPSPPSSSSDLIIKETTTTTQLDDEWNFDISPYGRFGFTYSQVKQLAKVGVISSSDVEQSLIEFNYDLDNNTLPQIKTNKLNFLMGLLRSGHSYISEGFKNEQEALIAEMAMRAETKRKKLLEERFISWEANLSQEERKVIERNLPTQLMVLNRAHGINNPDVRKFFLSYFIQNQV